MHPQDVQYLNLPWADSLDLAGRELVSLVGAGGKTSLMLALAQELALAGQRVIITTTTHIWRPEVEVVQVATAGAALEALGGRPWPGEVVCLASGEEEVAGRAKLRGLAPEEVDRLWLEGAAEYVLVEADGARGCSIKAPRAHEPVIPAESTVLVGLIGLAALGKPLDGEQAFNPDLVAELTGLEVGQNLTPEATAGLVLHPEGLFKGAPEAARRILFLNGSDLPGTREQALELLQRLGPSRTGLRALIASVLTGYREVFDLA